VLANLVAVADPEVAAHAIEVFVERVRSQYGTVTDLVGLSQGSPALDIDIGIEHTVGTHDYIGLYDTEFAYSDTGADNGIGGNYSGVGDYRRWIDGHEFV
jgi:hypothetical protein